jgi:hypothetical protein
MDLQSAGGGGGGGPSQATYGWIGIRITNDADATGEVVGWGYETQAGVSILAGETNADFNGDGKVDAADYVNWRKLNGGNETAYNEWRTHFAEPSAGASEFMTLGADNYGVPEPSSLLLTIVGGIALVGMFFLRRIRRS